MIVFICMTLISKWKINTTHQEIQNKMHKNNYMYIYVQEVITKVNYMVLENIVYIAPFTNKWFPDVVKCNFRFLIIPPLTKPEAIK